ncbi:adenine phosphoribosyltransferase [Brachybacterium endophyticum]|uniref:Adenine phosphoribosyltransferase n=1 Tax=Brachybacterium endophyticum TaxID=2182385 RepID=A0A2U2RJB9_9MICO|nr:adenine phosphoribosyltransferase [Brachybacterium endophyticum]PWH05885.1 adenine phosphoribosyltransferase [Brachybacterium endophyticum]
MTPALLEPSQLEALMSSHIETFPDFPEPGVLFRDITPLLRDPEAFRAIIGHWGAVLPKEIDLVVGVEARGFVLGAPLALSLGAGFVPARKAGKLPGSPRSISYDLEYGSAEIEIGVDSLPRGTRIVVVDDLLATGGTAAATIELVREFDVELLGVSFLLELEGLGGRDRLPAGVPVTALSTVPN